MRKRETKIWLMGGGRVKKVLTSSDVNQITKIIYSIYVTFSLQADN